MLFPDVLHHLSLRHRNTVRPLSQLKDTLRLSLTNLAAVLLGAVWAADWCSGDGTSQLGVCAQHGVRLTRSGRTQLPDAGRQFCPGMVFQYVSFPFTRTLVHLQRQNLLR